MNMAIGNSFLHLNKKEVHPWKDEPLSLPIEPCPYGDGTILHFWCFCSIGYFSGIWHCFTRICPDGICRHCGGTCIYGRTI